MTISTQYLIDNDPITAYSLMRSKNLTSPKFFADTDPNEYPFGQHRLIRQHEKSGPMNLYIASYVHHIEGLDASKSQELVDILCNHARQEKYILQIDWHHPSPWRLDSLG